MKSPCCERFRFIAKVVLAFVVALWLLSWILSLPVFNKPTSTVLEARDGSLLSARIAKDGQWRFPLLDSIPTRFEVCLLDFEDKNFYWHPGVDPKAIIRAMRANYNAGRVVQGGSTLTMQIARMLGDGAQRSIANKLKEIVLAFHLEVNQSKNEILISYCSNAPFGGNVVGLEAAAWRYYGRSPYELSWAESATLAVLPNAPSLIYPGKGQIVLERKRNRLLKSLFTQNLISEEEYELSLLEPLPDRPLPMPMHSLHLMDRNMKEHRGERIQSEIELVLQERAQAILNAHVQGLKSIEVYNGALIILDTRTQKVLAYVGNANYTTDNANLVDCIRAPRNSGSILKPIIYASMLNEGELTPNMLIPDIPSQFSEYSPENYHGEYDGAVPANEALYRSLNIPFVRLLKKYGVARFQKRLTQLGLSTLNRPWQDYGLSLMLGGAEVRLDELTRLYAIMGQSLAQHDESYPLARWAIHHTFKSLCQLTRPVGREYQRSFTSSRKVAWKTGTSYGHKDAWAIGVTPDYTIGVWMGNADGEGRNGLTGVGSAAPLLFDVLDLLPSGPWFSTPMEPGHLVDLCVRSGYIAGRNCPESIQVELPAPDYSAVGTCSFHRMVYITEDEKWQGSQACAGELQMEAKSFFTLPPVQEWYYKVKHADYRVAPPYLPGCQQLTTDMEFIYPQPGQRVYIPVELDGEKGRVICKLAHRDANQEVFWYLDQSYLGSTHSIHEMPINCLGGQHRLLAVDESGAELGIDFEVLSAQ